MYLIYYEQKDSNKGLVCLYQETDKTELETRENYALVENIPVPETKVGMSSIMYINLEDNEIFYEYRERELTKEEQLQKRIAELESQLAAINTEE